MDPNDPSNRYQADSSGFRRKPDGYHHLPEDKTADVHRSSWRNAEAEKEQTGANRRKSRINVKPAITNDDIMNQKLRISLKSAKEMVSLTDAKIICSGGRGLGEMQSGFELIEEVR